MPTIPPLQHLDAAFPLLAPSPKAPWVAMDTETTGVTPIDTLVEIGAIAFADDGTHLDTFSTLINPGRPIPADATEVHGIGDADVVAAPSVREALHAFTHWLWEGSVVLGHNAGFDTRMVSRACRRSGIRGPRNRVIDTLDVARRHGVTAGHSLGELVQHHGLTPQGPAHRALPDCDAVRQYFLRVRGEVAMDPGPWLDANGSPGLLPPTLRDLPQWIDTQAAIRFRYQSKTGYTFPVQMTPLGWFAAGAKVMVEGWCHRAQDHRTYAVGGMGAVTLVEPC